MIEVAMVLPGEALVSSATVAIRVRAVSIELVIDGDPADVERAGQWLVAALLGEPQPEKVRAGAKETRPARVSRRRTT